MARQVKLLIQKDKSTLLSEYNYVRIHQDLHTHHTFEVSVPFDYLEGRKAGFMKKVHSSLVGKLLDFSLERDPSGVGRKFAFTGLVTDIVVGSDSDYTGSFLIRGYSPSCLLTDGVQKRTFVKQTLSSIIDQVLQPYQANLVARAKNLKSQATLPYVVQYDESNFDFLNRLMAECHEWFFYDGATLQFGLPKQQTTVQLEMNRSWSSFQMEAAIRPGKVVLHSYDPVQHQRWDSSSPATTSGISSNHFAKFAQQTGNDVFAQPSHAYPALPVQSRTDVKEATTNASAALAAGLLLFRGHSENPDLRLGTLIEATAEGLGSDNLSVENLGKYRIVSLSHEVTHSGSYANTFTAVLHSLVQPPANPHVRPMPGLPELAEVIDVADNDNLGRVRVRYYWPVAKPGDAESCWVRVLTPYAGDGKGQLFTPEVGSQVLMQYERNRAEQPVVLGNLFHAKNKQTATYSQENNNIKSLQTAGGNKIVFHDKAGEERILISNGKPGKRETKLEIAFGKDGDILLKTKGNITLDATKKISLISKEISLKADSKITLDSSGSVDVKGTTAVKVEGQSLELSAQTTAKLAGQTSVKVEGATAELSGSAMTTVKGTLVKIN